MTFLWPNFYWSGSTSNARLLSSTMAKSDKKVEKKADIKAKTEAKAKVGKKVVDTKKTGSAIPSAKHAAPISSKEILARVCARYVFYL